MESNILGYFGQQNPPNNDYCISGEMGKDTLNQDHDFSYMYHCHLQCHMGKCETCFDVIPGQKELMSGLSSKKAMMIVEYLF